MRKHPLETPYAVPLWRRPTRSDVNILTKQRDDAYESGSAAWECMDMGREVVAAILGEDKEGIAPMFIPEAIRTACYRAATGGLRDEVTPADAASRRVVALEAELAAARAEINTLKAAALPTPDNQKPTDSAPETITPAASPSVSEGTTEP